MQQREEHAGRQQMALFLEQAHQNLVERSLTGTLTKRHDLLAIEQIVAALQRADDRIELFVPGCRQCHAATSSAIRLPL